MGRPNASRFGSHARGLALQESEQAVDFAEKFLFRPGAPSARVFSHAHVVTVSV